MMILFGSSEIPVGSTKPWYCEDKMLRWRSEDNLRLLTQMRRKPPSSSGRREAFGTRQDHATALGRLKEVAPRRLGRGPERRLPLYRWASGQTLGDSTCVSKGSSSSQIGRWTSSAVQRYLRDCGDVLAGLSGKWRVLTSTFTTPETQVRRSTAGLFGGSGKCHSDLTGLANQLQVPAMAKVCGSAQL